MPVSPPVYSAASSDLSIYHVKTLAEQLSYLQYARPFKNPNYNKNVNRRTKNLKAVLTQEREREKNEREKRRLEKEEGMDVDSQHPGQEDACEDDLPTCEQSVASYVSIRAHFTIDASIEAPPSVLPQRRYCDITGLEVVTSISCAKRATLICTPPGPLHRPCNGPPIP